MSVCQIRARLYQSVVSVSVHVRSNMCGAKVREKFFTSLVFSVLCIGIQSVRILLWFKLYEGGPASSML